jgi:hypothetical protein
MAAVKLHQLRRIAEIEHQRFYIDYTLDELREMMGCGGRYRRYFDASEETWNALKDQIFVNALEN